MFSLNHAGSPPCRLPREQCGDKSKSTADKTLNDAISPIEGFVFTSPWNSIRYSQHGQFMQNTQNRQTQTPTWFAWQILWCMLHYVIMGRFITVPVCINDVMTYRDDAHQRLHTNTFIHLVGSIHLAVWRLTIKSHGISRPQDMGSLSSDRSDIWQASRQHRYRDACQIPRRYDNFTNKSRGIRDLTRSGGKNS